ncbi:MAG: diaminopimelate epimerase [Candidatus Sericytochromatia bacterium]
MPLAFAKYQGLGNDFILIEGSELPLDISLSVLAQRLCDRHFGIGADGLLLRWPSSLGLARMQVINADGSEPEMCGNGLRCFVRYLADEGVLRNPCLIETGAGLLSATDQPGGIRIQMGKPVLEASQIPALGWQESRVLMQPLPQTDFVVTLVSMGNPHCVIQVPSLAELDFAYWGPRLEKHPAFPARANVEFAEVLAPDRVLVKVWERGAGPTLACGTGACAVVVAGVLNGWLQSEVTVVLPGGELHIAWPAQDGPVWMEGPAEKVFRGHWEALDV